MLFLDIYSPLCVFATWDLEVSEQGCSFDENSTPIDSQIVCWDPENPKAITGKILLVSANEADIDALLVCLEYNPAAIVVPGKTPEKATIAQLDGKYLCAKFR